MKTHLHQIITAKNNGQLIDGISKEVQDAIAAVFWAGEAKARAEERQLNRIAAENAPKSRYKNIIAKTLANFNPSAVEGLQREKAEFLSWDFELSK